MDAEGINSTPNPLSFLQRYTTSYDGVCDKDGCDLNAYRAGVKDFFGKGPSFKVNTEKPITVVTQFITDDGTDTGKLSEIRRVYYQDGKKIDHTNTNIPGLDKQFNSLSDEMCKAQKGVFGDNNDFAKKGGMAAMGESLERGKDFSWPCPRLGRYRLGRFVRI